ncbi:MAG: hypothetical protein OEZ55_03255 [Nitrospinota bacterium]|nr:hypothetical protein [Nitrospinota bacterium]
MKINPKEIFIYALVGLTLAVLVNNVAELDVPFLNSIERAIVPPSERGYKGDKKTFDYSNPEGSAFGISEECKRAKTSGDTKILLRSKIKEAKKDKDAYALEALTEQLKQLEDAERQACE